MMTKLSGTRVKASQDALRYALFLVEKISLAPDSKYQRLLGALHEQWQPGIFQGTLPEAATIICSLDKTAWENASIDNKKDIETLVQGGAALQQRYGYLHALDDFLRGTRIVVAPGLLDALYQDIATVLAEAAQKPKVESRAMLHDCGAQLRERISSLEVADSIHGRGRTYR